MDESSESPPGRKILRNIEARRGSFYFLKAKMTGVAPRLAGGPGELIDLDGVEETTKRLTAADLIWQKIKKARNDRTDCNDDSASANPHESKAPGSKLRVLKDHLEPKMRQQRKEGLKKRCEEWERAQRRYKRTRKSSKDPADGDDSPRGGQAHDTTQPAADLPSGGDLADGGELTEGDKSTAKPGAEFEGHLGKSGFESPNKNFDCEEQIENKANQEDECSSVLEFNSENSPRLGAFTFDEDPCLENPADDVPHTSNGEFLTSDIGDTSKLHDPFDVMHTSPLRETSMDDEACAEEQNISKISTRSLLGNAIAEGDSQMPVTQDILDVCSGKFCSTGEKRRPSGTTESQNTVSTPKHGRVPQRLYDIFKTIPNGSRKSAVGQDQDIALSATSLNAPVLADVSAQFGEESPSIKNRTNVNRKKRHRVLSDSEDDDDLDADCGANADCEVFGEEIEAAEQESVHQREAGEGEDEAFDESDEEEAYLQRERHRAMEFFDDEAELSGNEEGSGDEENEDGPADDVWEEEAGDHDDVPSEDELRSQIGHIHWKQMLDDDKRQLLRYKEAFVRDDEGGGYRFRRNRNDDSDDDDLSFIDGNLYDEENANHDDEELEDNWRDTQRQRSKYLARHGMLVEDNASIAKDVWGSGTLSNVAKKVLNHHHSFVAAAATPSGADETYERSTIFDSGPGSSILRRESLLKRGKGVLEQVARHCATYTAGPSHNRRTAGVFTILSPTRERRDEECAGEKALPDGFSTSTKTRKFRTNGQSIFKNLQN